MMQLLLHGTSILLFAAGMLFGITNWRIFIHNLTQKGKFSSFIPFMGGGLMSLSIYILQEPKWYGLILCVWVIDFFGIPYILYLIAILIKHIGKKIIRLLSAKTKR